MSSLTVAGALSLALLATNAAADCVSYGMDFQDGGSYFQNITSTDPFTFVSHFEGCQPDVCYNILVDTNGTEYQCSDTQLTPDDSDQMSTCPLHENQLRTGAWSVVLISNDGNGQPIAYQRDFYLSVGTPVTAIYTPTVTVSVTTQPYTTSTIITTSTNIVTKTQTITSPLKTLKPTKIITPIPFTTTKIITIGTVKKTAYTVVPTVITKTQTKTCSIPRRQPSQDPTAHFTPTLVHAAALETENASTHHRRADNARRISADRAVRAAERTERLAAARGLQERGLNVATTTLTDLNTADYKTTTWISTLPVITHYFTQVITTNVTSTITTTAFNGTTAFSEITAYAPTPTKARTEYTLITATVTTITKHPIVSVTMTTAPADSTRSCKAKGGKMV